LLFNLGLRAARFKPCPGWRRLEVPPTLRPRCPVPSRAELGGLEM